MCLIARHLEANGIATVCVASALDIIEAGRPPRSVFIDYPLGHTVGRPFDPDNQRTIVRGALSAFEAITTPGGIMSLDIRWSDNDNWKTEMADDNTGDTRAPRDTTPQYQTDEDRIAADR